MPSLPPAGWYPDPDGAGESRYWTGTAWGPQSSPVLTAEQPSVPEPEPEPERFAPPSEAWTAPQQPAAPRSFMRSEPRNTMATVALVLGLVGFVLGLIPYLVLLTWVISVPAAILGAIALRRPDLRGRATAGLLLGLGGLVLGLVITLGVAAATGGSDDAAPVAAPAVVTTDAPADAVADDGTSSVAAIKAQRDDLVGQLETSIEKDAKKDVADGLLTGPILEASCTPVSGSSDPLTDQSSTFTCFVATSEDADGTQHGHGYTATINWNDGSYTWQYEG